MLYITDILFKNIKSVVDPTPVIIMPSSNTRANARHLLLLNDGWGLMKNLRLRLSASPVNSKDEIDHMNADLSHELYIGDVDEGANIDVSSILLDYGFIKDIHDLEPPRKNLKRYDRNYDKHTYDFTKIFGEFVYEFTSYTGTTQTQIVKFEARVFLYEWCLSAMPPPPSYFYSVKFETDCEHYNVYKSVSQVLKPKEHDRFVVTIGLDKSSYHEFEIEVITNLGSIVLPSATLLAFIPRSGTEFVHEGKQTSPFSF